MSVPGVGVSSGDVKVEGESVREWLGVVGVEDDVHGEYGSEYGGSDYADPVASEFGEEDDELAVFARQAVADAEDERLVAEVAGTVEGSLRSVALAEQRMVAAGMRRSYVRGRVHLDAVYGDREKVRQRLFMVQAYIQMSSLDDGVLYERLMTEGRVVSRLGAPTGMGKTTKLPGMIAKRCGLRVCLVTADAHLAKIALAVQKKAYGIPGSSRMWIREKKAFLGAVSYEDFRGIVCSSGRKRFFTDFDVFVFDEPHRAKADVWLAKQYFGVFGMAHNSLLLTSATISTRSDNDVVATRVGKFEEEPVSGGFPALVASGKLITQYCTDRTLVIVADGRRVHATASYYAEAGCDVRMLDLGSSMKDLDLVDRWLGPVDAAVPRILVVHEEYGTAYNMAVSYAITSATRMIYAMDGKGGLVEQEVPLRLAEVQQHKGRTGRGLATGSGGIVASKLIDKSVGELMNCEKLRAYLGLIAADVIPRAGIFDEVMSLIPKGLTRDVAISVLSVELPPALVLRYLGTDGCIASRFVKAMELYVQPDHRLKPSKDVDPVGYSSWVEEKIGHYYEGDDTSSDVSVFVPFESPMSLKVIMHTIYAVSRKWMDVPSWRPEIIEDSASDDEDLGTRRRVKSRVHPAKLRLVGDEVPEDVPPPVPDKASWQYDVDPMGLDRKKRRQAMSWLKDKEGKVAVAGLRARAENRRSFGAVTGDVERIVLDEAVQVRLRPSEASQPVDIESPGGTVVLSLSEVIYEVLVSGLPLSPGFFCDVLHTVKKVGEKFVKSTLFDNWSAPWLSVLRTYTDNSCVEYAVKRGYSTYASKLVGFMYDRFRVEAISVCTTSNLYRSQVKNFFSSGKVSTTRLARLIREGRVPLAQSDKFIGRFLEIKDAHVSALAGLEMQGVFAPHVVSKVQRAMPLRRKVGRMPVVGEDVIPPVEFESGW